MIETQQDTGYSSTPWIHSSADFATTTQQIIGRNSPSYIYYYLLLLDISIMFRFGLPDFHGHWYLRLSQRYSLRSCYRGHSSPTKRSRRSSRRRSRTSIRMYATHALQHSRWLSSSRGRRKWRHRSSARLLYNSKAALTNSHAITS